MADYVPSVIIVGGAIATIGILSSVRIPLFILFFIGIVAFFLVFAQHRDLFVADYRSAQTLGLLANYTPFLIVGAVILFSLFYIFFMRGTVQTSSGAATTANATPTTTLFTTNSNMRQNANNRNKPNANYLAAIERAI